jgi:hypothetical protein
MRRLFLPVATVTSAVVRARSRPSELPPCVSLASSVCHRCKGGAFDSIQVAPSRGWMSMWLAARCWLLVAALALQPRRCGGAGEGLGDRLADTSARLAAAVVEPLACGHVMLIEQGDASCQSQLAIDAGISSLSQQSAGSALLYERPVEGTASRCSWTAWTTRETRGQAHRLARARCLPPMPSPLE